MPKFKFIGTFRPANVNSVGDLAHVVNQFAREVGGTLGDINQTLNQHSYQLGQGVDIHSGQLAPQPNTGKAGDVYIQAGNKTIYWKVNGLWTKIGVLT